MGQKVIIIDLDTRIERPDGQVGEIWVSGPSVGQGYWDMPEETERIFAAHLAGTEEGPFLRTEDLGLFIDGELFVTGRMNEMIIIRGRNHYPHDIEETVQALHAGFRPGCGAAFGILIDGEEKLVIVQEIDRQSRRLDLRALTRDIRQAVAQEHGLETHDVQFLRNATIPKTTSGKVQRYASRRNYQDGRLRLWKGKSQ